MGQAIIVNDEVAPTSSLYGKRITEGDDRYGRKVKCLMQPAMSASRSREATDVEYTWDLYCDDADLTVASIIELPGGDKPTIHSIESYSDEVGIMYQVVHC